MQIFHLFSQLVCSNSVFRRTHTHIVQFIASSLGIQVESTLEVSGLQCCETKCVGEKAVLMKGIGYNDIHVQQAHSHNSVWLHLKWCMVSRAHLSTCYYRHLLPKLQHVNVLVMALPRS